jgi:hypothetical protein
MRRSLDARGTRLVSRVRAAGSAHENRDPTTRAEAGTEQVISMRDYEVGHYLVGDGLPTS